MKSGFTRRTVVTTADKSRTSPIVWEAIRFASFSCLNKLGLVGGSSAKPCTSAPSANNHSQSHEPLKPVCPVTSTFLF